MAENRFETFGQFLLMTFAPALPSAAHAARVGAPVISPVMTPGKASEKEPGREATSGISATPSAGLLTTDARNGTVFDRTVFDRTVFDRTVFDRAVFESSRIGSSFPQRSTKSGLAPSSP